MISISKKLREDEGFTLIELLIVIVVLGILAGIVLFAVGTTRQDAEGAKTSANNKICKTALQAATAKSADSTITEAEIDAWTDGNVCDADGTPAG